MLKSTMMDLPLTLNLLLDRAATIFGDVEILSRRPDKSTHRYCYRDMAQRAHKLARALMAAGVEPGDRVATLMWNHHAHLEAYFGIPAAGGVLHTLNLRLHADDIAYIASHAKDRILLVDDILLPLFEQFRSQWAFERVIVFSYDGRPHDYEDYEAFIDATDESTVLPQCQEDWACGMCYTSGTTGRPKGVLYGHKTSVLHALGFALPDVANLSSRDVCVPVVPMFHAMAWGIPYAATMVGARQALPGPHLDADSLLELFTETGTTLTAGVPTIWMGILTELQTAPNRWRLKPGMRMISGGSATPPSLIEAFRHFDLEVISAWGMTETSPVGAFSCLLPEIVTRDEKEQCWYQAQAGVPVPMVDVRIVTEEGIADWDGNTIGELQVRGPWVTGSYYLRPDAADSFTDDGWFRTGDVASITSEGYVHIADRTKDLIKSGGEWISSVELENELMGHPLVAEAAVIAIAHERWMERPLACVVPIEGAKLSEDDLRSFLAGKFAKWWVPDAFVFIDEIPRTSTGKFMKLKLREQFTNWQWPDQDQAVQ